MLVPWWHLNTVVSKSEVFAGGQRALQPSLPTSVPSICGRAEHNWNRLHVLRGVRGAALPPISTSVCVHGGEQEELHNF